jgi:hypothetical protein
MLLVAGNSFCLDPNVGDLLRNFVHKDTVEVILTVSRVVLGTLNTPRRVHVAFPNYCLRIPTMVTIDIGRHANHGVTDNLEDYLSGESYGILWT